MNRSGIIFILMISVFFSITSYAQTIDRASGEEFNSTFEQDAALLQKYTQRIDLIMRSIEDENEIFDRERKQDFSIGERERLYTLWAGFLDCLIAIEDMNAKYRDFYLITDRERHAQAFLIAYTSYISKLSAGYRFVSKTIGNDLYEKKLDDAHPSLGIPTGMYARLKWNTVHVMDVSAVMTGHAYMKVLAETFQKNGFALSPSTGWMFPYIEANYTRIKDELKEEGTGLFASNGMDILKDGFMKAWFPVQMNVAMWMGDTKVKRKDSSLITEEQVHKMDSHLEPGDIILERRNWYLSNIGLPGFWPHAELYIGTEKDMASYFSDPEVDKYFRSLGDFAGLMDYLEKTFPDKMAEYRQNAHDNNPRQIIEAISEGVSLSSLEEATLADYIAVLRPRLSKLEKARAIVQAFRYLGRPYDFDFDFLTDSTIVCSELIYKAYLPGEGKKGLHFTLKEMAGRQVLPPNDIAGKFDREYGSPEQELDFVYFLDGNEAEQKAFMKAQADFRKTCERPKWDIAQK